MFIVLQLAMLLVSQGKINIGEEMRHTVDHSKVLFIVYNDLSKAYHGMQIAVKITTASPECLDAFALNDSCSLTGSSALNKDTLPENILTNDDTYWSPAIRSGRGWSNYLQFFMRIKFRLSKIKVLQADDTLTR